MNKINALWVIIFVTCARLEAKEKAKTSLRTSVIIPCHPKHAKYLYELLKSYEKQTILPDEVVISISEEDQVEPSIIKSLKETSWPFSLKLLLSKKKLFAGQNRNIACKNATGDVFICQDADDIPHSQRIEIIKYFFETLNLDFLLHKYVYNGGDQLTQIKKIEHVNLLKYAYVTTCHEVWIVGYMLFGQPAFHKRVFQKIQWLDLPIGEDMDFDARVMRTFKNCIMVHCPLYIYRNELSATPYELYRSYGTRRSTSMLNSQNFEPYS